MMPVNESLRPDSLFAEILGEDWRSLAGNNSEIVHASDYEDFLFSRTVAEGRSDLWFADADSGQTRRLTRTPSRLAGAGMAWSRQLFFLLSEDSSGSVRSLSLQRLADKTPLILADTLGNVRSAQWEPYENWLYYLRADHPTQGDLYRMTWQGTHPMNLTRGTCGIIREFEISPDGRRLAFAADSAGSSAVWNAGLTFAHREKISPDSLVARSPRFNPSGEWVAFLAHRRDAADTTWDLLLWDSRDDHVRVLAESRAIRNFSWSLDGLKLLLEVGVSGSSVRILDVETGSESALSSSLDEVRNESRARAHRWLGKNGLLYESSIQGHSQLMWSADLPNAEAIPVLGEIGKDAKLE